MKQLNKLCDRHTKKYQVALKDDVYGKRAITWENACDRMLRKVEYKIVYMYVDNT